MTKRVSMSKRVSYSQGRNGNYRLTQYQLYYE